MLPLFVKEKLRKPKVQMNATIVKKLLAIGVAGMASFAAAADLVDTAEKSSEIRTFYEALKTTETGNVLKKSGPYTVFAPSNSAFDKLPPGQKDALLKDREKLQEVLAHHVMPEKLVVAEVKPGPARTLNGEITLKSDNGKVTVDEANVTLSDIEADNGVIHIIDTVLLPEQ